MFVARRGDARRARRGPTWVSGRFVRARFLHTLLRATRVTSFTNYLKATAPLPEAGKMANQRDTRTAQLFERRPSNASVGENHKVDFR